jgi:hypothetical protein
MKRALSYLERDLSPEMRYRYEQWKSDDGGCDLISFMDGLDVIEEHIWALQEVYIAYLYKEVYARRMTAVKNFSTALKEIQSLSAWVD